MAKPILETDRLLLRHFNLDDAEAFFRMVSDPEVTRYTGGVGAKTLEEARKELEQRPLRDYQVHGYGRFAAVYKATGQVIGFAGLKYLEDVNEVDLGYRFFKEYWGQGLATEASKALVPYGFDVVRLPRIIAFADPENKASRRVLEKVGFTFEKLTTYQGHNVAWYGINRTPS